MGGLERKPPKKVASPGPQGPCPTSDPARAESDGSNAATTEKGNDLRRRNPGHGPELCPRHATGTRLVPVKRRRPGRQKLRPEAAPRATDKPPREEGARPPQLGPKGQLGGGQILRETFEPTRPAQTSLTGAAGRSPGQKLTPDENVTAQQLSFFLHCGFVLRIVKANGNGATLLFGRGPKGCPTAGAQLEPPTWPC